MRSGTSKKMLYDNPQDYIDDEEEKKKKQRRWCVKKALKLAQIKSTEEQPTEMESNDIVEAAEKFNDFIKKEEEG